jgi:peptidoglycan/LPS O-acetylase OafA/YrhL
MSKRIRELDGLRGLAILVVMLHNESSVYPSLHLQNLFANGWMGVDLFFVLSGFLITGILLDTRESDGYFTSFYSRRCLRIWPLYFTLLLFMFVVVPFVRPAVGPSILERSSPWWAYPVFLQNFLVPNSAGAAGPLGVTWSLAIEEQFYLVWPLFVRYCTRKQLLWIALAVICLSPVMRLMLRHYEVNLYTNLFSRLDGLMAGAMLAVLARSTGVEHSRFNRLAWFGAAISLVIAFAAESAGARWVAFSFSAVASAALVHLALYSRQTWFHKLLSNRFLVYTGTISYGLYLLHKIPFDAAKEVTLAGPPLLNAVLLFGVCYLVAAASWNVLEKPFLRLKRRAEPGYTSSRLSPSFN